MTVPRDQRQRIARLTPLENVLQRIAQCVNPVNPQEMPVAAAVGATLAHDVVLTDEHPVMPLALIDGWAIQAELTADAGPYAPTMLSQLREVAVGEVLHGDCDAVAALDSATWRNAIAEVHSAVSPGEGVLLPGTDAKAGEVLKPAGHRLRCIDLAAMRALGIAVARVRKPRIQVASVSEGGDAIADAIACWLADAIAAAGGEPVGTKPGGGIEAILTRGGLDAVVMVGGTGTGARDGTVQALKGIGSVEVHGIALSPGETAAFGMVASRPVLLVPGRLDAAMAVWLLIGQVMMTRLCDGLELSPSRRSSSIAKITSTVGLSEFVLVRETQDGVEPLASKYLPLATLAQADGWIVIPAASEGLPPGATVTVYPLP